MAALFSLSMNAREVIILLSIVVVAFLFRSIGAGTPVLNGDEGDLYDMTLDISARNISGWQRQAGILPPLSMWVATFFVAVFGPSEWALRFYGAIFGSLTVVIIYFLARLQSGRRVALYAALLAAVLPLLVLSNRDAHPDNVLVFFSLLSICCCEYGRTAHTRFWFVLGGISAGLAIVSKYNAFMILTLYWVMSAVLTERKGFMKYVKMLVITGVSCGVTIFFMLLGSVNNFFYLPHGILFWTFNQTFGTRMPWYYLISVLFDGLSSVVFVFVPVALLVVLLQRKRSNRLNVGLCVLFLTIVDLQGRKFPRHVLLALPFLILIVSDALFVLRECVQKKRVMTCLMVVLVVSAVGMSLFKIREYQQNTTLREVGAYALEQSEGNTTLFIDGIEYWSFTYYTNYSRKVVARLEPGLVKKGDIVVVHRLNASTPFFIGSPLQNDLTLYTPEYGEQYKWNVSFYEFAQSHGSLLKEFPYDKYGNTIAVYVMHTSGEEETSVPARNLDLFTQRICDMWQSCSKTKYVLYNILPQQLQDYLTKKCTQGCVWTCDMM